jgi:hypothetical protein
MNRRRAALRMSALLLATGISLGLAPTADAATATDPWGYSDARLCEPNYFAAWQNLWTTTQYWPGLVGGRPGHITIQWRANRTVVSITGEVLEDAWKDFKASC